MAKEAKSTYIVDPEAASHSLASLSARAEVMGDTLKQITGRIAALEAGKPWGTAEEYGGRFESVYHAGDDGAGFVRSQATILATETSDGASKAHQALRGSVELDAEGAALFRVSQSDPVGARMSGIHDAVTRGQDAGSDG
jgi:hypothetical protein